MKNQDETHYNICARTPQNHEDMDHPFKTLASLRAEYDAEEARKEEAKIKLQRVVDGRDARSYLRLDVKKLLNLHYQAALVTISSEDGARAEMEVAHLIDEIRDTLDTLGETVGI